MDNEYNKDGEELKGMPNGTPIGIKGSKMKKKKRDFEGKK